MSEVLVPFGDNQADTATLLLAAVEELGDDVQVSSVKVDHFDGGFRVPEEVAKKAGLKPVDPAADFQAEVDAIEPGSELPSQSVTAEEAEAAAQAKAAEENTPPAKKAVAKKAPAKKAAAKKSTAKGK